MFADSFLDSPWTNGSRRRLTTAVSFTVQALGAAALAIVPLLNPGTLPQLRRTPPLLVPAGEARPMQIIRVARNEGTAKPGARSIPFTQPLVIPNHVTAGSDARPARPDIFAVMPDGVERGFEQGGVRGSVWTDVPVAPAPMPALSAAPPPRISHIMEGNLVRRVQPVYPALAVQARIQGMVVLTAVISREGIIENLQVVSGHPMLIPAALEAVRKWRYRPYLLNGEPVEVETQIMVNFTMSGS